MLLPLGPVAASIALPDAAGIRSRQDGQITNWQAAGERTGALATSPVQRQAAR